MCGLNVDQFNIILDCALPYIHVIPYPDCVGGICHTRSESVTELLLVLIICCHGLHQGIMGYNAAVQRIFCGYVIFLATLFNEIDLKPPSGYTLKKISKIFVKTGNDLTDCVIDATEFKFHHAFDFKLNSLIFSNYKTTQAGKVLVGISPHGGRILFSDIYPRSISESKLLKSVVQFISLKASMKL